MDAIAEIDRLDDDYGVDTTAAVDSTGMCLFIAFAVMDQPDTFRPMRLVKSAHP
jgi:hypothetical protein